MAIELKGADFYTFREIRFVTWSRQDEVLAQKQDEIIYEDEDEDEVEYRDWQDELDEILNDAAWRLLYQYEEGYNDGAVDGLKKAIGEAVIEGFKKYFNIRLKGNAKSIGEEVYLSDESWTGEGIEISLDEETLGQWLYEQNYSNFTNSDLAYELGYYFGDEYNGKIWVRAYTVSFDTTLSFEFDDEEFEEEDVTVYGEAVTYKAVKEEILKQFREWVDSIERNIDNDFLEDFK